MQTIDSPVSVRGHVQDVLSAGYHGIIRYVSPNTTNFPAKKLTTAEAASIHSVPGMRIGLCYEFEPATDDYDKQLAYFTADQAKKDAGRAIDVVYGINAPKAVPVFYGADFDPRHQDLSSAVLAYFTHVHDAMEQAGLATGVYGSGASCAFLKQEGVVGYTWLAMARRWAGYAAWKSQADIIQLAETSVAGLSVDTNFVVNESVLW